MQPEINQSIILVSSSQYFWWYMGSVISLGMLVGAKFDDGLKGLKRSISVLFPYFFILFITNGSRLVETSWKQPLGATAYNSIVTLLAVTFFYGIGLIFGHLIKKRAVEEAQRSETKVLKGKKH